MMRGCCPSSKTHWWPCAATQTARGESRMRMGRAFWNVRGESGGGRRVRRRAGQRGGGAYRHFRADQRRAAAGQPVGQVLGQR